MRRLILFATPCAVATMVAAFQITPMAAQEVQITLANCKEPREPVGAFNARGVVRGELGSTGQIDTVTVTVGSVSGMSATGFRSAVTRQVSACTFRISPKHTGALLVLQEVVFDSGRARVRSIPASRAAFTPLELPPAGVADTSNIWPDSLVEEHPRRLECKSVGSTMRQATTVVPDGTDLERMLRDLQERHSGLVQFTFVLGRDGRFIDGSSAVISATNPSLTQDAIAYEHTCRYTPARMQGVPVSVRLVRRLAARVKIE